jgi:hypothetical protein
MAYQAWAVAGTQLQVGSTASPLGYATIKGVEGFTGPTGSKPDIDVTAIDDTATQYVAGVPDYGSVSFDLFWDPAETSHQELYVAFQTVGGLKYFKIICADTGDAVITFSGEVKGWEWDFSKGAAAKVKTTVKLSGSASVTP